MKGFMAVWGDGWQARCSFVFSEKNCSHHFPLSLAPIGRRLKTKSHLPFQTELGYSTEQPGQRGVQTIYFYHAWHVQDMGKNVHSRW